MTYLQHLKDIWSGKTNKSGKRSMEQNKRANGKERASEGVMKNKGTWNTKGVKPQWEGMNVCTTTKWAGPSDRTWKKIRKGTNQRKTTKGPVKKESALTEHGRLWAKKVKEDNTHTFMIIYVYNTYTVFMLYCIYIYRYYTCRVYIPCI